MDTVFDAAFTADSSKLLAGVADHALRLWDLSTGRVLHTLTGHAQKVRCMLLMPSVHLSSSIIVCMACSNLAFELSQTPSSTNSEYPA